jgi:hypothetical protein
MLSTLKCAPTIVCVDVYEKAVVVVRAEVLRDLTEVVAELHHRGHEVRRVLQQAVVEVPGDERACVVEQALDRAVRDLVDHLLEQPVRRVVRRIRRRDDRVDHFADLARSVRREVEVRPHLILARGVVARNGLFLFTTATAATTTAATTAAHGFVGRACGERRSESEEEESLCSLHGRWLRDGGVRIAFGDQAVVQRMCRK